MGAWSAIFYFSWWLGHPLGPVGDLILAFSLVFHTVQVFIPWGLVLVARRREAEGPRLGLSVDVFVTAYREPQEIVSHTLRLAVAMNHPHLTYLLDDAGRPELEALAKEVGAKYMARPGNADAKAGNINFALARTSGEIVAILDADHAPRAEFLERTLGHFADPEVGFVQAMLSFRNSGASLVARAASELVDDFFNAVSLGMDRVGSCTHFGSNGLIRRSALESIGGYQAGLAEDLATSLELHAGGWKSAFVHAPLAPGLVPPDLRAYFAQQLKWARGVFEELLRRFPRVFWRLTWPQRLSYLTRLTFYTAGLYTALHFLVVWVVLFGPPRYQEVFAGYVARYLPLLVMMFLVDGYAIRIWTGKWAYRVRGTSLAFGTWPVYLWAALLTAVRWKLPHLITRKTRERGNYLHLVLPQIVVVLLTSAGIAYLVSLGPLGRNSALLVTFAVFMIGMHFAVGMGVVEGYRGSGLAEEAALSQRRERLVP